MPAPYKGAPVIVLDSNGNVVTSFNGGSIANGGGSITVNNDGSITIVGLASGSTLTGGLSVDSLTDSGLITLTAASSRIVPGATSLSLRNHANGADNLILTDAGNATLRGLISSYDGITTAGIGVPVCVGHAHITAQTGSVANILSYTPGADSTILVQSYVLVTAAGTSSAFNVNVTFTDEASGSRTLQIPFAQLAATTNVISIVTAQGAVPVLSAPFMIRAKGSTAVTLQVTSTAGSPTATWDLTAAFFVVA